MTRIRPFAHLLRFEDMGQARANRKERAESGVTWVAVAAMARNRVIGREGTLPWHLPGDLKFFKKLTTGGTILMGRKTYESIGRPLPHRRNLVLSRSGKEVPGAEVFSTLDEVRQVVSSGERIFVIGGAEIYRLTLDLWDEVYLTLVKREVEGDTYLPEFEERFARPRRIHEEEAFAIDHFTA